MNIFKVEKRYSHLKTLEFDFPETIINPKDYFKNELEFMAFFILNQWFHRKYGVHNIVRNAQFTPDITANIIGFNDEIQIEVEYDAHNFVLHNHQSNYIDLIISFIRNEKINVIKSIPVWSVYKYHGHKRGKYDFCTYTLDDDIAYNTI